MTAVNLTADEAQALLDGINAVIQEKAKDIAWFSEVLNVRGEARDQALAQLRAEKRVAESARRKISAVR